MRVLVTGASGFIGQYCVSLLQNKGYEVHAVSSVLRDSAPEVTWHRANLLAEGEATSLIRHLCPTHLLHLSWCTEPGKYWNALENIDWLRSSLAMVQAFTSSGGKRFVGAGSCAEYDWSGNGTCSELRTPLRPGTLYGTSKHALQLLMADWYRQTGLSCAWARVFSLYGPNEYPQRLVASSINNLIEGKTAFCGNPQLIRDYLHVEDVASAFVALVESELQGPINIGSGYGVQLGQIVTIIGEKLGASERVLLQSETTPLNTEPERLVAENSKLTLSGWAPKFNLEGGLDDTISWWRNQRLSA